MASKNSLLRLADGAVPVATGQNLSSVKLWCEYAVFGLLFHDDQSPWLSVVECLHICFDRKASGKTVFTPERASVAEGPEDVTYSLDLNHSLRHLLFRDREILKIADGRATDDRARWASWMKTVERDHEDVSLGYLQKEFADFGEMARSVELLRTAEIEPQSPKRWTSRHVLPLGSAMLFPDVDKLDRLDRKYMRRTGEMLYLMLNRSERRQQVGALIDQRLLQDGGTWNRLARRLAGGGTRRLEQTRVGYLPMPGHEIYDRLAEDWEALLSLRGIPVENLLDPLERVSGLLQILYVMERSQDVIGDNVPLAPFFLDMVGAAGSNPVRKLSANQYRQHRTLPLEAMASFVDGFARTDEWKAITSSDAGAKEAAALLAERFLWKPKRSADSDRMPGPKQQIDELRNLTQVATGHSIVSAMNGHARNIGMLRAQRRSGTWYAPNDAFLEALVLANVTSPMEFGDFLARLAERYNIVIGPEELRAALDIRTGSLPVPLADLRENERRLEDRLRTLGFLDRKSDDCAFVINPFFDPATAADGADALVNA
jgi:hypothetical protein